MAPKIDKNIISTPYHPNPQDNNVVSRCPQQPDSFTPESLKLNMNNFLARLNIHTDTLMGRMTKFLQSCPLHYALSANPGHIYHRYLCEFWYTASVGDDDVISFTLKEGTQRCVLSLEVFRNALHLNYLPASQAFSKRLKNVNFREVLVYANHSGIYDEDNNLKTSGTIFMSGLTNSWRYFWTNIVECLGGNSGGLDQITLPHLEMGYYLWKGRNVDFAEILFSMLISKLKGKRKPHISFPRFLSICFQSILRDAYEDEALEHFSIDHCKDFSHFYSEEGEVEVSPEMLQVINKTGAAIPAEPERTQSGPQKKWDPSELLVVY